MAPPDPLLVAAVRAGVDPAAGVHELDARLHAAARRAAPLLHPDDHHALVRRVRSDLVGLGPLDDLLADPTVQEVMVNGGRQVWVDRHGLLERVDDLDDGAVEVVLERILAPLGRRLDRLSPTVDARLPDGSRVCAAIPPVSPDGPTVSIRRFAVRRIGLDRFASTAVCSLLAEVVAARCNVVVSGATSSGKTTLLVALTGLIGSNERIVTLEDTTELRLASDHVVRLECRSATADGVPAIGLDHLLRTALRLRPDRLVVGEVRGAEAVSLVQAMSTGHDGSMATVHANDADDALRRLEVLVLQGAPAWPLDAVRHQVRASIDVVVHVERTSDGTRRIRQVCEVTEGHEPLRPLAIDGHVVGSLRRLRRAS